MNSKATFEEKVDALAGALEPLGQDIVDGLRSLDTAGQRKFIAGLQRELEIISRERAEGVSHESA